MPDETPDGNGGRKSESKRRWKKATFAAVATSNLSKMRTSGTQQEDIAFEYAFLLPSRFSKKPDMMDNDRRPDPVQNPYFSTAAMSNISQKSEKRVTIDSTEPERGSGATPGAVNQGQRDEMSGSKESVASGTSEDKAARVIRTTKLMTLFRNKPGGKNKKKKPELTQQTKQRLQAAINIKRGGKKSFQLGTFRVPTPTGTKPNQPMPAAREGTRRASLTKRSRTRTISVSETRRQKKKLKSLDMNLRKLQQNLRHAQFATKIVHTRIGSLMLVGLPFDILLQEAENMGFSLPLKDTSQGRQFQTFTFDTRHQFKHWGEPDLLLQPAHRQEIVYHRLLNSTSNEGAGISTYNAHLCAQCVTRGALTSPRLH
eukprot:GFYU01029186.1.p1 GENE.GFYU01029186.1~~GFYU01029186.1.p1  ORF type:complete len:371 (+),score=51.68 GFYU01029186.1:129-1241(+)